METDEGGVVDEEAALKAIEDGELYGATKVLDRMCAEGLSVQEFERRLELHNVAVVELLRLANKLGVRVPRQTLITDIFGEE